MTTTNFPQIRIVPIRMLNAENAEKFLDGLSYVAGIRRVLVHGPGYQKEYLENPRDLCDAHIPSSDEISIADQDMNMHVLMGDVIVEALDEKAIDKVAVFCKEFFDDLAYQIHVGRFIKSDPSLSDYLTSKDTDDPYFMGMTDSKPIITPQVLRQVIPEQSNT